MPRILVTDRRAKGELEIIYDQQTKTYKLHFSDLSGERFSQEINFKNEKQLEKYLANCTQVDTWEIYDRRIGKHIYFHRDPLTHDIDRMRSEYELNYVLSQEGSGCWMVEKVGMGYVKQNDEPIYFLENVGWLKSTFAEFQSEKEFIKAYEIKEQKRLGFYQKLVWSVVSGVVASLGSQLAAGIYRATLSLSGSSTNHNTNNYHNVGQDILNSAVGFYLGQKTGVPYAGATLGLFNIFSNSLTVSGSQTTQSNDNYFFGSIPLPDTNGAFFVSDVSGAINTAGKTFLAITQANPTEYIQLFELNSDGTLSVNSTFEDSTGNNLYMMGGCHGVVAMSDGSVVIVGNTELGFSATSGILVLKLSSSGALTNAYSIGDNTTYYSSGPVTATSDDAIAIVSSSTSGVMATFCTKLTSSGTLLWSVKAEFDSLYQSSIAATNDGGVAFLSILDGTYEDALLTRLASNGDQLWIVHIPIYGSPYTNIAVSSSDNSVFVLSTSLLKIAHDGSEIWNNTISGYVEGKTDYEDIFPSDVAVLADGKIVVTGWSWSDTGTGNIFLLQWDSSGENLLWSKIFLQLNATSNYFFPPHLTSASNANLLITSRPLGVGPIWFASLPSETGSISHCSDIQQVSFTVSQQNGVANNSFVNISFTPIQLSLVDIFSSINFQNYNAKGLDTDLLCKESEMNKNTKTILIAVFSTIGGVVFLAGIGGCYFRYYYKHRDLEKNPRKNSYPRSISINDEERNSLLSERRGLVDSNHYLRKGEEKLRIKQYREAIDNFKEAIRLDNQNQSAYLCRGRAYLKLVRYEDALLDAKEVLNFSPKNVEALLLCAHANLGLEKNEETIKICAQVIKLNSQEPKTYYIRGKSYLALKKYSNAILDFEKFVELNFDDEESAAEILYLLGQLHESGQGVKQNDQQAINYYRKANLKHHLHAQAALNRHFPELEQLFKKAEQGDPESQFLLSKKYLEGSEFVPKNNTIAVEWLKKASAQHHVLAQYYLGQFYEKGIADVQKNISEATRWYQQAASQKYVKTEEILEKLQSLLAYRLHGEIWLAESQYDKVISICDKAIALNNNDVFIYFIRARAYFGLKNYSKTIEDCSKVVLLNIENKFENIYAVHLLCADACRLQEKYEQAIESSNKIIFARSTEKISNKEKLTAYVIRANSYLALQRYKESVLDFQKVIELNADDAKVLYQLGWLYENGKGVDKNILKAIDYYEKAVAKNHTEAKQALARYSAELLALIKKAEKGDAASQFLLAEKFETGKDGLPQSNTETVKWLNKSAVQNYAPAQYKLGWFYELEKCGLKKDIADAVSWYQKAVNQKYLNINEILQKMQSALAYRVMAENHQKAGQYVEAIKNCDSAIALNSNDPLSYWIRGESHYRLQQYPQTIEDCTKLFTLDPSNQYGHHIAAYGIRADAFRKTKQYANAMADSNVLINNSPNVFTYQIRAESYLALERYADAVADFQKIIELAPKDADACYQLGWLYENGKGVPQDVLKAISYYEKADAENHADAKQALTRYGIKLLILIKKAKSDAASQFLLAEKFETGSDGLPTTEVEVAKWLVKSAAQNYMQAQYKLGWYYELGRGELQKNTEQAISWYRKAVKHKEQQSDEILQKMQSSLAYRVVAQSYQKAKNYEKVIEHCTQALILNSLQDAKEKMLVYQIRAEAYLELKQYEEAIKDCKSVFDLDRENIFEQHLAIYQMRLKAYAALEKHKEAIEDSTNIIKLDPKSIFAYEIHAKANLSLKKYVEALNDFMNITVLDSKNANAWYQLGKLFEKGQGVARDIPKAIDYYEKAVNANNYSEAQAALNCYTKEVIKLIKEAEKEHPDPESQFLLGEKFEEGKDGLPKSESDAVVWFTKAAEQNNPSTNAQCKLGWLRELGKGTLQKDIDQAIYWYSKAANRGHAGAGAALQRLLSGANSHSLNSQPKTPHDLPTSFLINRTEITFKGALGTGGYGSVYQGIYKYKSVAIKELKIEKEEDIEKFRSEMALMANLHFDNIVHLFGVYLEPCHGIVMEYMTNGSLYSVLKSALPLDLNIQYKIALDIACGINFLHDKNILHRDLKSPNVLLDANFTAKLGDFGLSKLKMEESESHKSKEEKVEVVGTTAWMAPEVLRGEKYTKKSDIYSYGIILWELVTRKVPYEKLKHDHTEIKAFVLAGNREDIPEQAPHKLARLIKVCWSQEQKPRYEAKEIIAELQKTEEETESNYKGVSHSNSQV